MSTATPVAMSDAPSAYILHAREINAVARATLRVETRDATFIARKISIGLSLQAIELSGKAILRCLGWSSARIRERHNHHDVLSLLREAEVEINARPEPTIQSFHRFLSWPVEIDGMVFRSTVEVYLSEHFSRGLSARPRNYFYPDEPTFTAPKPVQTVLVVADYLINIAGGVASAVHAP